MKKYIIITLVLVLIGVIWGININLQNKASIGVIGGADGPTAILVAENTDVDIEEIKTENVAKEWTKQEITELFKRKADAD